MVDKAKADPKANPTPPDTLARTSEKGEIELNEEDLNKVTGGVGVTVNKAKTADKAYSG